MLVISKNKIEKYFLARIKDIISNEETLKFEKFYLITRYLNKCLIQVARFFCMKVLFVTRS